MNFSSTPTAGSQARFSFPQLIALCAAALLATASVVTNVSSAIARQPDLAGQIVGGSIAAAVAALTTVALAASLQALARKRFALSAMAAVAFGLSAAFSVSSALGIIGGARLQAAKTVEHVENERTRVEFERRNAVNELATTPTARAVAEIVPELARRLAIPGVNACVLIDGPVTRTNCPVIADLQAEKARAEKRSALAGQIAQYDRDLAALGAPTIANKDAAAIAHVLAALGFSVTANSVNTVLMIIVVMILECGGSLALATAEALRPKALPTMRDITPPLVDPTTPVRAAPVAIVPAVIPDTVELTGAAKDVAARVEKLVRDAGGTLQVRSKYELAKRADTSSRTLSRALAAGAVAVTAEGEGLVLTLAG